MPVAGDAVGIRRALVSVADKTGLQELARVLVSFHVELLSTGGTLAHLRAAGIAAVAVAEYTDAPEILDGRVKTLHPKIQAGILARRDRETDRVEMERLEYPLIDLVVVNLYPFEATIAKENVSSDEAIEQIDIGGPTLVRAAAKNHRFVTVVTSPADYPALKDELQKNQGSVSLSLRQQFAQRAFAHTAAYDGAITEYLSRQSKTGEIFPEQLSGSFARVQALRYGENPHQQAALYRKSDYRGPSLATAKLLSGKEPSYNNLMDLDFALSTVLDFSEPCAVIVKHANPCGLACDNSLAQAYQDAYDCDPLSAYGCIIGLNRKVDVETAQRIDATPFVECVLAPDYAPEVLELLQKKKNRRLVACLEMLQKNALPRRVARVISGGLLVQTPDTYRVGTPDLKTVTQKAPTADQIASLLFAFHAVKQVKSNAIVIAQKTKTVGIGGGVTSRVDAVRLALDKAGDRAKGAVLASDAFFPMPDSIDLAARAGIAAIIQPGGSKADPEVIAACDQSSIAMVFTGIRHFRH